MINRIYKNKKKKSATHLHETVLDAASLVNSPIPIINSALLIEDTKATYSSNPLTA